MKDHLKYKEESFVMRGSDYETAPIIHELTYRQRCLLSCCQAYKESEEHGIRLYKEFEEYFRSIGETKKHIELRLYAGIAGKSQKKFKHEYFIFPPDVSKRYGFKYRNHVVEDLNVLEGKGFIKTFRKAEPSKRGESFKKNQTIYEALDPFKGER